MLKNKIRYWCQQLIGLDRYLFLFAMFSIFRIRYFGREKDFRYFMRLLPPAGIILDIGANIGAMSAVLARQFPQSQVYAFEPVPLTVATLQRVKAFFKLANITVRQTALGQTTGSIAMQTPWIGKAAMHGLSHIYTASDGAAPADCFAVPLIALDQEPLLQAAGKITGIKIDVENFEYEVLLGGRQVLQQHQPIVLAELWNDEKKTKCMELMKDLGYTVKVYYEGKLVDYRGEDALNYFFLPPKREVYI